MTHSFLPRLAATAAALACAASAAQAQSSSPLASLHVTQTTPAICVSHGTENAPIAPHALFVPGSALAVTSLYQGGGTASQVSALFSFGPLNALGRATQTLRNGVLIDSENFAGGSFTLRTANSLNTLLLSGSFSSATLSGPNLSPNANNVFLDLNNIQYTGGNYATSYRASTSSLSAASGLTGGFRLDLSGAYNPTRLSIASDGYFNHFDGYGGTANGGFSVNRGTTAVPEPASVAAFGLGVLGLAAMGLRARKTRRLA